MKPGLNLRNLKSFTQAATRIITNKLFGLPMHIQEQVAFRHSLCENDCFVPNEKGKIGCKYCGCDPWGKAFGTESCNDGERFPDLMNDIDWTKYKKGLDDYDKGIH